MKIKFFNSIKAKLTTLFLAITAATLLVALSISYIRQIDIIEERSINKLTAIRDLKMALLNQWYEDRIGDIRVIAGDYELRKLDETLLNSHDNDRYSTQIKSADELLNNYLRYYNGFEELFIISIKNGEIIISTNHNAVGLNKSNHQYFNEPAKTGEIFTKDIYYSNQLNKPTMTISIPIYCQSHKKNIIGILVGRIDLKNSLYPLLSNRVGLGETGETLIVNKDVVSLSLLRWYDSAPLSLTISAEPAVNAAAGKTGTTVTTDYRNEPIMAAYAHLPKLNWGFVCKQDISEINFPIRQIERTYSIVFIITLIIGYFISHLISSSFTKPIINMNYIARQIRSGNLGARNKSTSNDELGNLANEFDNMANEIQAKMIIQEKVAKISGTIISHTSMISFAESILKQLMKISEANMSVFYVFNEQKHEYEHFTSIGANKNLLASFSTEKPEGEIGEAVKSKSIMYHKSISENSIIKYNSSIGTFIPREIITIPIIYENIVIAVISMASIKEFTSNTYEILSNSWTAINSSYSNILANERTKILAEQLTRINQQLEAQTEELQEQSEEMQNQAEELQITSNALHKKNKDLEVKQMQVESANRMKSEFLSNMSHELRTPLNSILALSKVLIVQAKLKLDNDENNYLEIIERNGQGLLNLINDILDLSKIEAGKLEVMPQKTSIKNLIRNVCESIQALAESKGLELTYNIPDDLPYADTDESRLYQVVLNVIGNAVKFTEKGNIEVRTTSDDKNITIKVKDTGIGISNDVLPHIFEEFRQADGTTSRNYEGTGLGLAIAKKLIHILGGDIKAKSKVDEGSEFYITIPIQWKFEKKNIETSPFDQDSFLTDFKSNNKNILLVEDNEDAILQIKSELEKNDFTVDVALNGREALEYLSQTIPLAIILDLILPEINGFKVLETIRKQEKTRDIPVIIITAKDLTNKEIKLLRSMKILQLLYKGDVDIQRLVFALKKANTSGKPENKKDNLNQKDKAKINIAIIEDNPDNMTTIKAILGNDYKTKEYYDGQKGLEGVIQNKPDLVLLDISLPGLSGIDVMKHLKSNPDTNLIPIIAVTAQAMKGDKESLLSQGFNGYVSKPINPDILKTEIHNQLISTT